MPRKKSHDGSVVCRAGAVQQHRVVKLSIQHRLEHDFTSLLWRKRLYRQFGIAKSRWLQLRQVFELAVEAARQAGQGNVQFVKVLARYFFIHFNDQRVLTRAPCRTPHGYMLETDAFVLNGLHEIHERRCSHHGNGFSLVGAEVHAAQATAEGLFGQDVALRRVGAQTDNGGYIAHIPAFFQHEYRHNCLVR